MRHSSIQKQRVEPLSVLSAAELAFISLSSRPQPGGRNFEFCDANPLTQRAPEHSVALAHVCSRGNVSFGLGAMDFETCI
jgi:hypothetical protein